uniref:DUF5872 domain-containing protein n=1 Tax=viral metagenome TaxID=1070528 RepID=A0A6C0JBF3_9ZZZZ
MLTYKKCLSVATKRNKKETLKLCPRGYCTAKSKYNVYPSAYANGYAVSVCKGTKPDYVGKTYNSYKALGKSKEPVNSDLSRWYKEEWVNVCEKGTGPGGYAVCGSGKGVSHSEKYPYCRPYNKLPGTTVMSVDELTHSELEKMCISKRSIKQGINGKPSRVYIRQQLQKGGGIELITIPHSVKTYAREGLVLKSMGYKGGTETGWNRGKQLSGENIDVASLADMRTWFARHGPDAINNGTSYPGYLKWVDAGSPRTGDNKNDYRGAVSWLLWGGDSAYKWLKTPKIRKLLTDNFPNRKISTKENNLRQ